MNTNRRFAVFGMLVLGALMTGVNAEPARAQALEGEFTLTSTTRWGSATLPPGNYSFTLDQVEPGSLIKVSRGARTVAFILAGGYDDATSGRSAMYLENGTVRKLRLPYIGRTLKYGISKPHGRVTPRERELAQIIPVTATVTGR